MLFISIGETCEKPLIQLPFSIRETFDDRWSTTLWSRINGGQVTSLCGTLDHGQALHFHEVRSIKENTIHC